MKKILFYVFLLLSSAGLFSGCIKGNNYPDGVLSPIIALTDVRQIYKGTDVTLTSTNMFGATKIVGTVISDFSGGNLPSGLLIVQNNRRTRLRGIAISIGAAAASYAPGDSVNINVEGGVLTRIKGILQITGINPANITKISSGNALVGTRAPNSAILANPDAYESTLVAIVKGGFDPLPAPTDKFSGEYALNDGFGDVTLHTESAATFATTLLPVSANYTCIVYGSTDATGAVIPQLRIRTAADVKVLSSVIEVAPFVISGFCNDPNGSDGNYEYIQLLATRNIDFSVEKFSVITCNNAGASTPTGFPTVGWATGGLRSYKIELTSGTVTKGSYFYVGGTAKRINGANSTDISSANWISPFTYSTTNSPKFSPSLTTVGTLTSNLIGNSGNAGGVALFTGTDITAATAPFDAIFLSNGGSIYDPITQSGYRVPNSDFYDKKDPISLVDQPFFKQGSNTLFIAYPSINENAPSLVAYFAQLGGQYNPALGRWVSARALVNIKMTGTTQLTEIESATATKLK